jgi:hypothetical protein
MKINNNKKGNLTLYFALLLVLGIIIGFLIAYTYLNKDSENIMDEETDLKMKEESQEIQGYELRVSDQFFGEHVLIDHLSLKDTVWVAIYEDRNGKPGNILGAKVFDAGEYENQQIELLRATQGESTYYTILHFDDGDRKFDFTKDLELMEDGKMIQRVFRTHSGSAN